MPKLYRARQLSRPSYAPANLPEDRRLTVAVAAKAANLTVPQIWYRITTGKLQVHVIPPPPPPPRNKRGRRPSTFIDLKDLEALIKLAPAESQVGS
jgi:hypothetical protein